MDTTDFYNLAGAAVVFVGSHLTISNSCLRPALIGWLGERGYRGLFAMIATAALAWLVQAYRLSPFVELWDTGPGLHALLFAAMLPVLILAVGALHDGSPTANSTIHPPPVQARAGVLAITRHPLMWSIGLWAALHAIACGDVAAEIFFSALAVLALAGTVAIDSRIRRSKPELWAELSASTSNLPLAALLRGRIRLDLDRLLFPTAAGLVGWMMLLALHDWLFGVSAF
ncbi:MAG TPA: NnrU family protein [Patescibacteria group bacterium]|nr:NnrU family protein [Patescibacteria group bacterium]